jgi:ABC-type multidrug transport system fused ATPase/permease subunit
MKGKDPIHSTELASLPSTSKNMFENLSTPISGSGTNLSQGQQQLLFVVRALLSRSKIVVFDEATSAVDMTTDEFIQEAIRDWFVDRTLIVIAHRLSTICRFDRIVVMDAGRVVEIGTPQELWEKEGVFYGMCEKAGRSEREKLIKIFSEG